LRISQDEEGVRVVLSSVQLAAVLTQESISESATLSNRMWGGLKLVGGVLELAGAGVLCVAPEPMMVSKAGCVILGATAGNGVVRATGKLVNMSKVLVILKLETYNGMPY
jgi:hypothetical protein